MGEVITAFGAKPPEQVELAIAEGVVETLERLLERAKEGKILDFAYGYVGHNDDVVTGWERSTHSGWGLLSAISIVMHRYNADILRK